MRSELLADLLMLLFGRGEELGGSAFVHGQAERLFDELARRQTFRASEALGLNGGFTFRRNGDFDDAGHQGFSI